MAPLRELRLDPAAKRGDSLVVALQGVLAWHGLRVEYGELVAATGLGAMFALAGDPCPARAQDFGRDAFLVEAAAQYGLSLRDLHPPDAAPLPDTPPEFELHWRDSYLPLVAAAIAHEQPVLAWMGWPAPNEKQWGVITAIDTRGGCSGLAPGCKEPVPLERAAVQAYVAQEFGRPTGDLQLLRESNRRALAILNDDVGSKFGIVTGVIAMHSLAYNLSRGAKCIQHNGPLGDCVRDALAIRKHRRELWAAWLDGRGYSELARLVAESGQANTLDRALAADEDLIAALEKLQ